MGRREKLPISVVYGSLKRCSPSFLRFFPTSDGHSVGLAKTKNAPQNTPLVPFVHCYGFEIKWNKGNTRRRRKGEEERWRRGAIREEGRRRGEETRRRGEKEGRRADKNKGNKEKRVEEREDERGEEEMHRW